jgi:hypothetical protein
MVPVRMPELGEGLGDRLPPPAEGCTTKSDCELQPATSKAKKQTSPHRRPFTLTDFLLDLPDTLTGLL